MVEYKTVAGPVGFVIGKADSYSKAVEEYAKIIQRETKDGWVLDFIQEIPVSKHKGCLAAIGELFGVGSALETITFNMLVFKREKTSQNLDISRIENLLEKILEKDSIIDKEEKESTIAESNSIIDLVKNEPIVEVKRPKVEKYRFESTRELEKETYNGGEDVTQLVGLEKLIYTVLSKNIKTRMNIYDIQYGLKPINVSAEMNEIANAAMSLVKKGIVKKDAGMFYVE